MNLESSGKPRMTFLDNARSLLVLGVVLLHAACGYSGLIPWWHVRDAESPLASLIIVLLDVFLMPMFFFIAGFFAPASLADRSVRTFISRKAKRLLAPLILLTLFYLPGMVYLGYLERDPAPKGFFAFWLQSLSTLSDFRPHLFESYEQAKPYLFDLSLHHLWFVSLLFIFFVLFAVGRRFLSAPQEQAVARGEFIRVWLLFCFFIGLGTAAINLAIPAGTWFKWNILLLFQPIRLPLYFGLFCLGDWSRSRGWLLSGPFPGGVWLWLVGTLLSLFGWMVLGRALFVPGQVSPILILSNAFLRTLVNLCLAAFLCNFGLRRLNRKTRFNASLAASSYDVYLLHMPIVVFLEYLLLGAPVPVPAKLAIAAVAAALISWGLSEKLVRPRPVAAVSALLCLFICMCVFVR
jgi:glucans biosynthesis protein C